MSWLSSQQRDSVEQLSTRASLSKATKETATSKNNNNNNSPLILHNLIWYPNTLSIRSFFISDPFYGSGLWLVHFFICLWLTLTNGVQAPPLLMGAQVWKLEDGAGFFHSSLMFPPWIIKLEKYMLTFRILTVGIAGHHHNCQWQTFFYKDKFSPNLCEAVPKECHGNSQYMCNIAFK